MTSGERPFVCAASVTGAHHLREGRPCQDAYRAERLVDTLLLVVADGHGSSPRGAEGAELALEAAGRVLAHVQEEAARLRPAEDLRPLRRLVEQHARGRLVRLWRELAQALAPNAALKDFGSTLLCALWTPDYLVALRLGDGDLVLVEDGRPRPLLALPEEEEVGDETQSLCGPSAEHAVRALVRPAPRGEALLLLATDGYAKSYDDPEALSAVALGYLQQVRERGAAAVEERLPSYLQRVTEQGSGDDITCVLAGRVAPP